MEEETIVSDKYKERMNIMLRASVYIVLATFCFSLGYRVGMVSAPEPAYSIDEPVMNTDTDVMHEVWYELTMEGNRLSLYRMSEMETVLLASEEISSELFPGDDGNELKEGLVFQSLDAALSRFEDFVS